MADWHWRNTMKPVRFFALDARAVLPLLFCFLPFRLWKLPIGIAFTILFLLLERRGLTFPAALRAGRRWLVGHKRPAIIASARRTMTDFGK